MVREGDYVPAIGILKALRTKLRIRKNLERCMVIEEDFLRAERRL